MNAEEIKKVIWSALNDIDLTRLEAIFETAEGVIDLKVDGKRFEVKIEIKEIK